MFLGLDVGTTRVKAVILSEKGEVVESHSRGIGELTRRYGAGFSERDPEGLWRVVVEALRGLRRVGEVEAICVDATSGSFTLLDDEGDAFYPIILHDDWRAVEEAEELRRVSEAARSYEGFLPITPYLVLPRLMWLKKNLKTFGRAKQVLHESDYIVYMLTGEAATSPNTAGKSHALITGEGYLEEAYRDAGIPVKLMPPIKPIGAVIGEVATRASSETGIPRGTPVVNGVTDASAGDLTAAAVKPGDVGVTLGATLTVHVVVSNPVPDPNRRFYYKHYLGGAFLAGGATNAGSTILDALSNLLGKTIDELTREAEEIPPGAGGLLICPEIQGVRVPRHVPGLGGFILGLNPGNFSAGHFFRAAIEGMGIVLRLMLDAVEEVTGTRVERITLSGGPSRNSLLCQVFSDILGSPVATVEEPDSALGSAIIAAHTITHTPLNQMVEKTVKIKKTFQPNLKNTEQYREKIIQYLNALKRLS